MPKFLTVQLDALDHHIQHPTLRKGRAWLSDGTPGGFVECEDKAQWVRVHTNERYARRYYLAGSKQRYVSPMRRYLTTLFPSWSYVIDMEARENPAAVESWDQEKSLGVARRFADRTGYDVVDIVSHRDTWNICHNHTCYSRISKDHALLGRKGLGVVGPASLGVLRQIRLGFRRPFGENPRDLKAKGAGHRLWTELCRNGGADPEDEKAHDAVIADPIGYYNLSPYEPLDMALAFYVDDFCAERWGGSKWKEVAWQRYKIATPIRELTRLINKRNAYVRAYNQIKGGIS